MRPMDLSGESPLLNRTAAPVICVVGPTASGKSALAQSLGEALDGEVVSADSMQIYKGMDIGTGKVLPSERRVPHFGLDLIDPGEAFSAALFQAYARRCFSEISERGKQPLLCGGTGFYVRAAIDDYRFPAGEQVGNAIRDKWRGFLAENGAEALWEKLQAADPQSAALIPVGDTKRVIRAFELLDQGTSYAAQKEALASIPQLIPAVFLGIAVDPARLRERIDRRVDAMMDAGLLDEVESLLAAGFRDGLTAPQAIGYKELVAYLDGEMTLEAACEAIKCATHRYAKRQRTWFRKDKRIHWLDGDRLNIDDMLAASLAYLDRMPLNG